MSITEPVPDTRNLFDDPDRLAKALKVGRAPGVQDLIRRANEEYFNWVEFKNRVPTGINPEDAWAYLKFARLSNCESTPFLDKKERPFKYWTPVCLNRTISEIDRLTGGTLITSFPALPSREKYIISSLMDEAIASSQLEGANTEHRVAKEMLRTGRKPNDRNEQMIFNNWKAMQYIRKNAGQKLSVPMLIEIQTILTQDTVEHAEDVGRFRQGGLEVDVIYLGEVVHQAPNDRVIPMQMEALCDFANANTPEEWIHPIIKGAMLHFWIGYVHPFGDGNGRTARAVMYWYLLNQGRELFQYLSISKHFLRSPGQYVRAYVNTEIDDNDFTYFLVYNVNAIRSALEALKAYLQMKQQEIRQANQVLHAIRGLNARQKNIIFYALQHPETVFTIEAHRNSQGTSYQTARNDLLSLSKKGYFKIEKEGPRRLLFVPVERMLERLRSHRTLQQPLNS